MKKIITVLCLMFALGSVLAATEPPKLKLPPKLKVPELKDSFLAGTFPRIQDIECDPITGL